MDVDSRSDTHYTPITTCIPTLHHSSDDDYDDCNTAFSVTKKRLVYTRSWPSYIGVVIPMLLSLMLIHILTTTTKTHQEFHNTHPAYKFTLTTRYKKNVPSLLEKVKNKRSSLFSSNIKPNFHFID